MTVVVALQPSFSADSELALELFSCVRCSRGRPPLTAPHARPLIHHGEGPSPRDHCLRQALPVATGAHAGHFWCCRSHRTLLPQCWGGRSTLVAPSNQSRGPRSLRTTVSMQEEQGRGTKQSGSVLQCEPQTRLASSPAPACGPLNTTAAARQTLLSSEINDPSIHWEGISEDPLRRRCGTRPRGRRRGSFPSGLLRRKPDY